MEITKRPWGKQESPRLRNDKGNRLDSPAVKSLPTKYQGVLDNQVCVVTYACDLSTQEAEV